jgi:hypothetical protein
MTSSPDARHGDRLQTALWLAASLRGARMTCFARRFQRNA